MSDPASTPACSAVWRHIGEVVDLQRRIVRDVAREYDLSAPQLDALLHLDPGAPRPMGELAGAMSCDGSNVTGIIDRLERRGLVRRETSPTDRRIRILVLTAEGCDLRVEISTRIAAVPEVLQRLAPDELGRLADTLERVAAGMRTPGAL